jgi:hypothetical protein
MLYIIKLDEKCASLFYQPTKKEETLEYQLKGYQQAHTKGNRFVCTQKSDLRYPFVFT